LIAIPVRHLAPDQYDGGHIFRFTPVFLALPLFPRYCSVDRIGITVIKIRLRRNELRSVDALPALGIGDVRFGDLILVIRLVAAQCYICDFAVQ
jgi:hypothetical protein